MSKAVVDTGVCTGCGVCVDACPVQAIELEGAVAKVDPEKCTGCTVCVDTCPVQAISMQG